MNKAKTVNRYTDMLLSQMGFSGINLSARQVKIMREAAGSVLEAVYEEAATEISLKMIAESAAKETIDNGDGTYTHVFKWGTEETND